MAGRYVVLVVLSFQFDCGFEIRVTLCLPMAAVELFAELSPICMGSAGLDRLLWSMLEREFLGLSAASYLLDAIIKLLTRPVLI